MRLSNNQFSEYFPNNSFYLDDIIRIYTILKNEYNEVKIIVNDKEIDSIKNIKHLSINSIKFLINNHNEYITIDLNEEETSFYSNIDTIKVRGLLSYLKDSFKNTRIKYYLIYNDFIKPIIYFLIGIVIFYLVKKNLFIPDYIIFNISIYILTIFLSFKYVINPFFQYKNKFNMNYVRKEYSFYQDYKYWINGIILLLIGKVL